MRLKNYEVMFIILFILAMLWIAGRVGQVYESHFYRIYDKPKDIRWKSGDWRRKGIPAQNIIDGNFYEKK
jgi:hypothetical protein